MNKRLKKFLLLFEPKIPDKVKKMMVPIVYPSLYIALAVTFFTIIVSIWTFGYLVYNIFFVE